MQIIIIDNFPIMTQIPNTVFRLKIASSTFEYVTIVIDEYIMVIIKTAWVQTIAKVTINI